jgi:hypothetical protein
MKYFHLSFISNTDYEIAQANYNVAYESWISERENASIRPVIPFTEKPTMYNSLGWFYSQWGLIPRPLGRLNISNAYKKNGSRPHS